MSAATRSPLPATAPECGLLGQTPEMVRLRRLIAQVGPTDLSVLLHGESGTGKEVAAEALFAASRASGAEQLIKVNCAAIPSELLESELFGYEAGAFTGAQRAKSGKFELAHGGTIFLDEIGEMSPPLQAKLLRVLQDGESCRLGAGHSRQLKLRILSATNLDIGAAVAAGRFRRDVYHRLNGISLRLPPLRERMGDLPLLLRHFLALAALRYERAAPPISPAAMEQLAGHAWPGNVRELEHFVRRLVVTGDEALALAGLEPAPAPMAAGKADRGDSGVALHQIGRHAAAEAERAALMQALNQTRWNRRLAARQLGISYKSLHNKIRNLL